MILPIYAYGNAVLKKEGEEITADYPNLKELIENMWETMENASGIGLAAPQIGLPIRLFLVDSRPVFDEEDEGEGIRRVFINAEKIEEDGEEWAYEEGCLSIPDITGDVERPSRLRLRYMDENFQEKEEVFTGMNARVIQHEYDHIDGILFTEHLKPIRKKLIKRKLDKIRKGDISLKYKMKFAPGKSKKRR
ncbi:MAG: peptide deformylase [Bacteroidota bacterium]